MHRIVLPLLVLLFLLPVQTFAQESKMDLTGTWQVTLNVGTSEAAKGLTFIVDVSKQKDDYAAFVVNGTERISIPSFDYVDGKGVQIEIDHFASRLTLYPTKETGMYSGVWEKRRGKDNMATVPAEMKKLVNVDYQDPGEFLGRWAVKFADSDDLAVGIFEKSADSNGVQGTFLTTTGDYRYLAGGVQEGKLTLTCFDGGHAFLFEVNKSDEGLKGTFHSGNWYQTTWSATADDAIELPDAFGQTEWMDGVDFAQLQFPDLDGKLVSPLDSKFGGSCKIIEVFGSWCPNCHDAAAYLKELQEKYGPEGLSIVGLAFELTGDFEKDAQQVRIFAERNGTKYPVLIAGTADKTEATKQLQVLDRVRSFPTMIFLDEANNVKAIYTGFSGPATGEAYQKLRQQFENIIETELGLR